MDTTPLEPIRVVVQQGVNWANICTIIVSLISLGVALYALWLNSRSAKSRARTSAVWLKIDECMHTGYVLKESDSLSRTQVWAWIVRVGQFIGDALGYHAWRRVYEGHQSWKEMVMIYKNAGRGGGGGVGAEVIQQALNRIKTIADEKVSDGRIHPDFHEQEWPAGWTPDKPLPPFFTPKDHNNPDYPHPLCSTHDASKVEANPLAVDAPGASPAQGVNEMA